VDKRRKLKAPQQYQQRIERYQDSKRKIWKVGINGNNGQSGISLEEEFVMENENVNNVPMISEKVGTLWCICRHKEERTPTYHTSN
jgi:hypothetical protein